MIQTKLMQHQIEIVDFIKNKKCFALFADYGVGKSLCILKYIDLHKDRIKNVLIVAPKFLVLPSNSWDTEIRKHSNFEVIHLTGSGKNKASTIKHEVSFTHSNYPKIFLLNYDSIKSALPFSKSFDFVAFDESNFIKNPRALRTKNAAKLSKNISHRAVISGYPVTENLQDIYSQIFMLDFGESLGKTLWEFNRKYFHQWRFGWLPNKDAKEKISDSIRHFAISKKLNDCIELPERIVKNLSADANEEQLRMFNQIQEDYRLTKNTTDITMQYALQTLSKLHQICSGFFYRSSGVTKILSKDKNKSKNFDVEIFQTPKDTLLLEVLKLISPCSCILWCEFNYEILKLKLSLKANKYSVIAITSSDKNDAIKEKIKKFRSTKSILIANPKFMGFGETFTEAKYMINYSHGWSYGKRANAEARIYRKGAEIHDKVVYFNLFIKNSIEESILKTLSKKRNVVNVLKSYMEAKKDD